MLLLRTFKTRKAILLRMEAKTYIEIGGQKYIRNNNNIC